MKLFFKTRAKRNTTFVVMLVCLFAIASGVANACVLEVRTTHSHDIPAAYALAANDATSISAGHAGVVASHGADSEASLETCLKVCDEGSQSLLKQQSGFDLTDPGPAPLIGVVWTITAPSTLALHQVNDLRAPMPQVPIRVRFARLTL